MDRKALLGQSFWERTWSEGGSGKLARWGYFRYCFGRLLARYTRPGSLVCEIGCGGSIWVPLLARRGVVVWGIDYAEGGLEAVRRQLVRDGLTATLVEADVFQEGCLPQEHFDVVFSLGFIEHFAEGSAVVRYLSGLIRPGGVMVTVVPNLNGFWGRVQRWLDPEIYRAHLIYDPKELDDVHVVAGLGALERASYFGGCNPSALNFGRSLEQLPRRAARLAKAAVWILGQGVCWGTAALFRAVESRALSSHVVGVYRRAG